MVEPSPSASNRGAGARGDARDLRGLKLGFVSGRPASLVNGEVRVDAGLGRLIDALAVAFGKTTIALSVTPKPMSIHDHKLSVGQDDLLPFPSMPSYARAVPQLFACRRVIGEVEARSDVLVVQLPLDTILCEFLSSLVWLTPKTTVRSSPVAGAEMRTFGAPALR